jgi:hypothetical protein
MRSFVWKPFFATLAMSTSLLAPGCEGKKQTEYVAGISTQVVVPRDLKAVVVNVSVGGVAQFCRAYRVYDGRVQLPRSLGEFPSAGKPGADPLTVTVVGFTEELTDGSANPVFSDCVFNPAVVNKNNARVLRRSRQPYVTDEVLFLPMPLKFSCFDKACEGDDKTCKAGRCESAVTDERTLPRFTPDLLDGTGSACFSASECFAAAIPPVVVNASDCTYALPNTPSAPAVVPGAPPNPFTSAGDGLNVEVTFDAGYNREILDSDPVEGFTIPDPKKPQQFRLSPGLCDLVKGTDPVGSATPHRITALRASATCRAKGVFQPLCAADQLAAMGTPGGVSPGGMVDASCTPTLLQPSKSALMIIADDTENNAVFYTGEGSGSGGADIAKSDIISQALSDPAFANTWMGLSFFPGGAGAACSPHAMDVAPALTQTARTGIVAKFGALKAPGALKAKDTEVKLSGALDDAYNTLRSGFADANHRAVLVIGNRGFEANVCGGTPTDRASAARTSDKLDTYVAILARDSFGPNTLPFPAVAGAQSLAEAGAASGTGAHAFDARSDKAQAGDALRKIVEDLATCAYDAAVAPGTDAVLTYSDPIAAPGAKPFVSIAHDAACTSEGAAGDGWGYNATAKRIHVCGKACTDYRTTLRNAAAYSAQYGQAPLAVPLFAHQAACAPK